MLFANRIVIRCLVHKRLNATSLPLFDYDAIVEVTFPKAVAASILYAREGRSPVFTGTNSNSTSGTVRAAFSAILNLGAVTHLVA